MMVARGRNPDSTRAGTRFRGPKPREFGPGDGRSRGPKPRQFRQFGGQNPVSWPREGHSHAPGPCRQPIRRPGTGRAKPLCCRIFFAGGQNPESDGTGPQPPAAPWKTGIPQADSGFRPPGAAETPDRPTTARIAGVRQESTAPAGGSAPRLSYLCHQRPNTATAGRFKCSEDSGGRNPDSSGGRNPDEYLQKPCIGGLTDAGRRPDSA